MNQLGPEHRLGTLRDGPAVWGEHLGKQHLDWTGRAGKDLMGLQDFNLNYMGNRKGP